MCCRGVRSKVRTATTTPSVSAAMKMSVNMAFVSENQLVQVSRKNTTKSSNFIIYF